MYNLIEKFMTRLTVEDVNNFALKNNVMLSNEELNFTYDFIKKNWSQLMANPNALDLERYRDKFSPENFIKIQKLLKEYMIKFQNYL